MPNELTIAGIGLVGAVMGVIGSAVGSHILTRRKFQQDSRYEAYILFLSSLSLAGATPPGSAERWKGVAGLIEAKSRIALFGSRSVVESLGSFSGKHRRIDAENFGELAQVIELMRQDVGSKHIPNLETSLRGLLFEVGS